MAIRIKRSTGTTAPASLASGQLANVEGTGKLYVGYTTGEVKELCNHEHIYSYCRTIRF